MDKFGDYISIILNGVFVSNARKKELEEEIRDHLEMQKRELIEEGYSEEQAELKAIQSFGEVEDIRHRFKSIFTPYRRLRDTVNEKKILKESIQWTVSIVVALMISLSIRSYAFAATEVRQCSMQNTLYEGQRLIDSKVEYYYSGPKRGDIVIINQEAEKGAYNIFISNTKEVIEKFYKNEGKDKERLVKRVIGLPGDKIDIREGKVYLNGDYYNEPYVKGITLPNDMKFPVTVPKNEYFVMGDNREVSLDSRDIGFIGIDEIEGKVILRLWPLDKIEVFND